MHLVGRRALRVLAAVAATGVLAAIAIAPALAADTTVSMIDFDYQPRSVTIRVGDSVTWLNDGAAPHDAAGNGWGTDLLNPGGTDAVTFTTTGTYAYRCTIHPEMGGTVVVRAANDGSAPPTDAAGTPEAPPPAAAFAVALLGIGGLLLLLGSVRGRDPA